MKWDTLQRDRLNNQVNSMKCIGLSMKSLLWCHFFIVIIHNEFPLRNGLSCGGTEQSTRKYLPKKWSVLFNVGEYDDCLLCTIHVSYFHDQYEQGSGHPCFKVHYFLILDMRWHGKADFFLSTPMWELHRMNSPLSGRKDYLAYAKNFSCNWKTYNLVIDTHSCDNWECKYEVKGHDQVIERYEQISSSLFKDLTCFQDSEQQKALKNTVKNTTTWSQRCCIPLRHWKDLITPNMPLGK